MASRDLDQLKAVRERRAARDAAHTAVMHFDRKPDLENTTAAIEALSKYEYLLRRGVPVTHDERRDFEQRWDARVEAGRKRDGSR